MVCKVPSPKNILDDQFGLIIKFKILQCLIWYVDNYVKVESMKSFSLLSLGQNLRGINYIYSTVEFMDRKEARLPNVRLQKTRYLVIKNISEDHVNVLLLRCI